MDFTVTLCTVSSLKNSAKANSAIPISTTGPLSIWIIIIYKYHLYIIIIHILRGPVISTYSSFTFTSHVESFPVFNVYAETTLVSLSALKELSTDHKEKTTYSILQCSLPTS